MTVRSYSKLSICYCFQFGFEDRTLVLTVQSPDHCFTFLTIAVGSVKITTEILIPEAIENVNEHTNQ